MSKFQMDDAEISVSFRTAKDPISQIEVLADLNCVSKQEMVVKLLELGLVDAGALPKRLKAQQKARMKYNVATDEDLDKRMALYRDGLTDKQIASATGVNYKTINAWRRSKGLPRNYKPEAPASAAAASAPAPAPEIPAPPSAQPVAAPPCCESAADLPTRCESAAAAVPDRGGTMTAAVLAGVLARIAEGWPDARISLDGEGVLSWAHLNICYDSFGEDGSTELVLHGECLADSTE